MGRAQGVQGSEGKLVRSSVENGGQVFRTREKDKIYITQGL